MVEKIKGVSLFFILFAVFMKTIEVVAAIIREGDRVLATQRGYGEFEGMWEFPGGKIELGEEREEALKREIDEELAVEIVVEELVCTVEYDYPNFHLTMHCYFCSIANGEVELLEHKSARWLAHDELDSVVWLPADVSVVNSLRSTVDG